MVSQSRAPSAVPVPRASESSGSGGSFGDNAFLASRLGADFSNVQATAPSEAPMLSALAYTQGSSLFGAGSGGAGSALLGHELSHIVSPR